MLKFVLAEESEKEILYDYYPENSEEPGTVSFDKESGKCDIIVLHEDDRHQRYAMKLFKKIRDFASNGSFDEEGLIAWY